MPTCVIVQPSYIPWRGFFDLVQKSDVFVFYDDVQYDKHGWRNRNRIKTSQGPKWLTIPVRHKGNTQGDILIKDAEIIGWSDWTKKHSETIRQNYRKAPYFNQYSGLLESLYSNQTEKLCDFTISTTLMLANELGIANRTVFRSSELGIGGGKTERLVNIVKHVGADRYLSGPSAADYLESNLFTAAGIELAYIDYRYPEYDQLYPPYEPAVSILDLLFMKGPSAHEYIWPSKATRS